MHSVSKTNSNRLSFGYVSPIPAKTNMSVRSRGNISSPIYLKPSQSPDLNFPKYISPINKIRHDLAFLIKDLTLEGAYLKKSNSVCKALEICASEESTYQKEMNIIVRSVRESIYQDKSYIPEAIINHIYDSHTEAILNSKEVPYFYIAESAIKLYEDIKKAEENTKFELSLIKIRKFQLEYEMELKKKKEKIGHLKKKYQSDCVDTIKLKDSTIKLLEDERENLIKQISALSKQIEGIEKECVKLRNQTNLHRVKLNEVEAEKETINATNEELRKNLEELYKEMVDSENDKLKYKLGFEKSLLKLVEYSQREKNLEMINEKIVKNNSYLSVKAAEGFTELTPRPSFNGIEEILVEVPKTTREKVRDILALVIRTKGEFARRGGFNATKKITVKHFSKNLNTNVND